jgi:hypothetical protein
MLTEKQRQRTAQIVYDALVTIANADVFFDDAKRLKRIATTALAQLAQLGLDEEHLRPPPTPAPDAAREEA